jgi:hypothetical protein
VAKQATEAFKQLEKKHSKNMVTSAQNSKLFEDHLLPMLFVQDRDSGEIITQIFNFLDLIGGKNQLTPESKPITHKYATFFILCK